jgi:hypothetical protein
VSDNAPPQASLGITTIDAGGEVWLERQMEAAKIIS